MNTITLNCMVLGDSPDHAFVVEINPAKRVDHLKRAIKEIRPDVFCDVLAIHMVLWRVNIALDEPGRKLLAPRSSSSFYIETILDGEKLSSLQRIEKVFNVADDDENVHVLVERPTLIEGIHFNFY